MASRIKINYRKCVGGRIRRRTVKVPSDWATEVIYQDRWAFLQLRSINPQYIYCGFSEV